MAGQCLSQWKVPKAINFALDHWDGMTLFLRDGPLKVDRNAVDVPCAHCHEKTQLMFTSSEGGAKSWAIVGSLVNTARLHELDRRPNWPTCWTASCPGETRAISCASSGWNLEGCEQWKPRHESASPLGFIILQRCHRDIRQNYTLRSLIEPRIIGIAMRWMYPATCLRTSSGSAPPGHKLPNPLSRRDDDVKPVMDGKGIRKHGPAPAAGVHGHNQGKPACSFCL